MSALPPIATAKADFRNVRFAPESGHVQCIRPCLLWAKSGHSQQSDFVKASTSRNEASGNAERLDCAVVLDWSDTLVICIVMRRVCTGSR